ncbi:MULTISPECIES: DUF423 domain-containing protein [Mucilaginibacter]|jgi:uncharacterized membrane protein YgdD (TMEM256/DUF423 family)|uniref:DUF423 domain-containing protein n=2 Tax=Mucilaginibacter TaxID=423349 RepID=A0AAE6MHJ1_9SPHI|nr:MULTISPECIES: DUF423 domain-containing protein [Mucilaginibacter]NVM65499.1 uncharacterized membrane protein YgdD (TMEM256/DUF423 family) [Mucilaginibacter sp. SG538B]QEM03304.1 DUF423 domain-containing protein [Mucilaginibacter rubeus]QEM15922.1 DUF423 domain-containing protein [Mucilaginibacter gossypii]QTE41335.1 DUF423 domain-containing protein [Mucilaginibacter rubeus]QTE47939.1 DUF423 domain-containing protein [Mucilaginibacter rubeus]
MNKQIIITASFLGMLAVITGAFGAHGLKALLAPAQLEVWHTAVQYNFYHVFALLFLAVFAREKSGGLISAAYYLFTFGIIFFSGSLYLLSCRDLLGWNWLIAMGPITPIGGLLFILGWLMLALAAIRNK